ncbi:MFS transporter [Dictyobacter arantiisoli]|uniref:Multidrug efflux pump Tap n=1 Tax=Dictyobacter arantiisoli TaxID=2014874 RepID=A0A5A5TI51_9CHLR|nr:MFS transporter [Dictyobacter arantiisoli]GCF11281.1 MFS transporter [Dictyobacter arantiisoli]
MSLVDKDDQQPRSSSLQNPHSVPARAVHDPYQAMRFRDFRLLVIGSFIVSMGERMVEVALGWDIYNRTNSSLALGAVGLVLIIPVILLSLPAGHFVDRFNRKRIMLISQSAFVITSLGLTLLSITRGSIVLMYACLFVMGIASAFQSPASSALSAQTIPEEAFENSATWNSSAWQLASVIGPGLGGMLIGIFRYSTPVYALNALAAFIFVCLLFFVQARYQTIVPTVKEDEASWKAVFEGVSFLRRNHVLLAAITLDLFAVLLGGATTLLPVFSRDILHVGPTGLGWLRAAPSVGALCVAFVLTHRPPFKHAGPILLLAVAGFGIATIIFGLSHFFWLSLVMLFLLGGLDNVSVVIRSSLLLTRTPNEMRGRVSAVNSLFVGVSNELGGFESGLTAQLFGPLLSVVGGGIGTILVVVCVALYWPEMRRLGTLRETERQSV